MKKNLEKLKLLTCALRGGEQYPRSRVVYRWFDVYDPEEERL